jgi:hypothetical protein
MNFPRVGIVVRVLAELQTQLMEAPAMKRVPVLLVLVGSLFAARQVGAESWSKQLTPGKTGDDLCSMTVKVNRLKEKDVGEFLQFHVTVKGLGSKDLPRRWGELRVFNGKEFVSSCNVQPTGRDGEWSFSFRVAVKHAEKSTFTYAQTSGFDHISHWFYLKDFFESSAPLPAEPGKSSDAGKGDADALSAFPHSEAFAANVAWHKQFRENEIRMSWFLRGEPGITIVCTAELSKSKVTTSREVYDNASQSRKTRELSDAQVLTLRKLAKNLPPSAKAPELKYLVLVSVSEKGKAKTYLYNRLDLPRDIIRLYDLTGAYLDTDPVP